MSNQQYKCRFCNIPFSSKRTLARHQRICSARAVSPKFPNAEVSVNWGEKEYKDLHGTELVARVITEPKIVWRINHPMIVKVDEIILNGKRFVPAE